MLKETFIELLRNYTDNYRLTNELWTEIEQHYSGKKRHYHTLQHLNNLLTQLTEFKDKIQNWDTILFTLYYHDIIYNPIKSDNEEKSAELAESRLRQIYAPNEKIELCKRQIIATKTHTKSTESDTNFFIDADLSVLGQDWDTYTSYYKSIRKEYAVYPDFLYNAGRKKVVKHFLAMDSIFKTDVFYKAFETQAKRNLTDELNIL